MFQGKMGTLGYYKLKLAIILEDWQIDVYETGHSIKSNRAM